MKVIETEMIDKMHQVRILYEQVDAGFNRNARDRSDYLNDYEKI